MIFQCVFGGHGAISKLSSIYRVLHKLLYIADNYLALIRVELDVFADNDGAIALYRACGFEPEGVSKLAEVRDGQYMDILRMARIRLPSFAATTAAQRNTN